MRNVTPEMIAEFEGTGQKGALPVLMADLVFDSATLYMWTGMGTLSWNGNDYMGGGNLVGIGTMEENQKLEAKGLNLTLNGVPTSLVATALLERTRGRPFRLYLGAVDLTPDSSGLPVPGALIIDPYRIFTGLMDVMKINPDGKTASIVLSVESTLLKGQRANMSRYTAEDQKKIYPLDTGLDRINQLMDKEVVW